MRLKASYFLLFVLLCNFNCKKTKVKPTPAPPSLSEFEAGKASGIIQKLEMNELSGMVACQNMPNMLWAHNDSGDENRIYLIDEKANWMASFNINGVINRDWEDIASAKINNENYLLIGDIGDNLASYGNEYYIYRCKEPKGTSIDEQSINNVEKITFQYPDGGRDAEALLVDHETNDIYIITKRESRARVYMLPYPQATNSKLTATFVTELPFGGELGGVPLGATAGDISSDNKEIIVKNYFQVYYWKLKDKETIKEAFTRNYDKLLPYVPNPQEEAICWQYNNTGYFSIAEGTQNSNVVQLFYYKKK